MNYKKTSLYEEHEKLSAKIVPFAGFLMPVSYKEGLVGEYKAVRNYVGMFDVSHIRILTYVLTSDKFKTYAKYMKDMNESHEEEYYSRPEREILENYTQIVLKHSKDRKNININK